MPLTLITGPANAAKAGAVLERFRAALAREPVLVVPTPADVQHYQRLGMVMNEMSRAMGLIDLVPQVFVPPVLDKLRFLHTLVRTAGQLHQ